MVTRTRTKRPESRMLSDFKGDPLASKPKPPSPPQRVLTKRALLRRAKNSERRLAKWLILNDGPDPRFGHLTTSTGRVGHMTNLQFDALSRSYCGENKNEKLPAGLAGYWQKICAKGIEWGKNPLLRWHPSNANEYLVGGKALPELHIITADRHAELLRYEQTVKGEVTGG